jgi:WD40 repeat protein
MLRGEETVGKFVSPLTKGKTMATGLDDGSVYVWDVQDGRKIRQVMLNSLPQGPISCLNWIGEDTDSAFAGSNRVFRWKHG